MIELSARTLVSHVEGDGLFVPKRLDLQIDLDMRSHRDHRFPSPFTDYISLPLNTPISPTTDSQINGFSIT